MEKKEGNGEVPEVFKCPLSKKLMVDPVILSTGMTCDRTFIQDWLNSGKKTCPKSDRLLSHTVLIPNREMHEMITSWCKNHAFEPPEYNSKDAVAQLVAALVKAGALVPLIAMLEDEVDDFGMKEAATAILNLCSLKENMARAVKEGVVEVVMIKIKNEVLESEMMEILALLATSSNAIKEMVEMNAVSCLFEIIRLNPSPRDVENCMLVLFAICVDETITRTEMRIEEDTHQTLTRIMKEGTPEAKYRASEICYRVTRRPGRWRIPPPTRLSLLRRPHY